MEKIIVQVVEQDEIRNNTLGCGDSGIVKGIRDQGAVLVKDIPVLLLVGSLRINRY